jgi:hypothetical protein
MIIFILAHVAAAYYNHYCILGAEWNAYYSRQWHIWQAIFNGIIAFFLGLHLSPYFAVQFLATRMLIFNPTLNELRGKGFFYIGTKGIDGVFTKLFGKIAGEVYFTASLLLMIVFYIASVKWQILNIKGIEIIESLCR